MPFVTRRARPLALLLAGLVGLTGLAAITVPLPGSAAVAVAVADRGSSGDPVWTPVDAAPRRSLGGLHRRVDPAESTGYHLDLGALRRGLDRAPSEAARGAAPATISVPSPSGDLVEFEVTRSPVMQDALAAAHPEIQTYAGRTTSGDSLASIRLDVTPMGFHASVRGDGAAWYVDPAYNGVDQGADALYLSYRGDDLPARDRPLVEAESSALAGTAERAARRADRRVETARRAGEGGGAVAIQRTYRLALVTDPSYAAYFTSSNDQAVVNPIVTAEKVTLINRVNQVYGDDLSIRMLLVAGNDALNFNTAAQFTGANGRCGNVACYTSADIGCGQVIDTNRFVLGQIVGADRFDIGHIMFGPDGSGGGVAYLGAVGTTLKAGGCTGLAPPTGDGFAIDYVAHEMGHQFAGNHTFNGLSGSCGGGNREAAASVEPGSGLSVMAYAGICDTDNLQPHSDPYFSQRSQQEIAAFTRSAPRPVQEVQNIALSGFTTAGESFRISYGGAASTVTVGSNYSAGGLETALEAAEPSGASAFVVGSRDTAFGGGANGFQVTWSSDADIATPTVTLLSGTFTSIVGTYDNGGRETNQGFDNPAPTGNHNPTVTAPPARTIPVRTPFTLTGSATDADGDALVYLWEQNDPGGAGGGTALNSNSKSTGPLFRVFGTYANVTAAGTEQYHSPGLNLATSSPTRSFPDAAQVAAGSTNAATGSCPAYTGTATSETAPLNCFSEFLPAVARTMSFRLTARDLGGPNGGSDGGTSFADVTITAAGSTPFRVTSQAAATSVTGNTPGTLTWDVAGTAAAPVSAANVKISMSTDGGLTFPTVISASTPNDGTEAITWPNTATTQGRVKVEAVGNYFYDISHAAITVTPGAGGPTLTTGGNAAGATFNARFSDALTTTPTITAASSSIDGAAISGTASGLPAGFSLLRGTSSAAGVRPGTTQFTVIGTADADPGSSPVVVTIGDATAPDRTVSFTTVVAKDDAVVTYTGGTTGSTGSSTLSATVADPDATPRAVSGAVVFTDQTTGDALCTAPVATGAASCTLSAPIARTYQVVGTLTSTRYQGASGPTAVVITGDGSDATPPETTITAGPPANSFVRSREVTVGYAAEPGATYTCSFGTFDGVCPDTGSATLIGLTAGSYEFRVSATDAAGNTDPTPATLRFSVPVDDRELTLGPGPWRARSDAQAYLRTVSTAAQWGSSLTYRVTRATSLALVITRAPGSGSVDVFLGSRKLRTVSLAGSATQRQVVAAVAAFSTPTSGLVRIRTTSDRPVRIDGLAVRTSYDEAARTFRPGATAG